MADGYAQASGAPGAGQPAHRARGRQRDGRDLQRPGQPLAAGDHRRPAGALADDAAGEPDQPRRDPDAAPAGQVELRAAPRRGRAARARARDAPGDAAAEGPDLRLDPDGRLGRRGRRGRRRARRSSAGPTGRAVGRPGGGRRRSPAGSRRRRTRCWSPAPTSTRAAPGTPRSRSPSASSLPVCAIPPTGGGRLGFPEGHPNFRGVAAAGDRPGRRDARRPRPDPRRRLLGLPLLPQHPGPAAARGRDAGRRSPPTPTRRRGRRWATRSSPTSS